MELMLVLWTLQQQCGLGWCWCRSVCRWTLQAAAADEAFRKGSAGQTHRHGAPQGTKLPPSASGSMKCPFGTPCLHTPPHLGRQPCTQPHLAPRPLSAALPSRETERDCHLATPEEVGAGGPSTQ